MKRGSLLVGGLAGLVAAALWIPGVRLNAEIAAARREGIPTASAEVSRLIPPVGEAQNAAEPMRIAIQLDGRSRANAVGGEVYRIAEGLEGVGDKAFARQALATEAQKTSLARWVWAACRPRLDWKRDYTPGYGTLFPEIAPIRAASRRLVAAAKVGLAPEDNLLAAARLSALVRQEPGPVASAVGVEMGREALDAAVKLKRGREIERALGPKADVRFVLGTEPHGFLALGDGKAYAAGLTDLGLRNDPDFFEKARHYGSLAQGTRATGLRRWRTLWAALPKEATDYAAAAAAVDREMPKIDALIPSYADVMTKMLSSGKDPGRGAFLRDLERFEAARLRVRNP